MPELPYTALPTPATPIGDLKSWRLILRCAKCNMKVVLALTDIARTHGAALPVWRATDREASKVRLLAMAADYEVRAEVAHGLVEPPLGDEIKVQAEPDVEEPLKSKPSKRITMGLDAPVVAQRRPVFRPGVGMTAASS